MTEDEILGFIGILATSGLFFVYVYFIFKKPEMSNAKIGIRFTLASKIIKATVLSSRNGFFNGDIFISDFIVNIDWLLYPILTFISFILRKIIFGKKKSFPNNENNQDLDNLDLSKDSETENLHNIDISEDKKENKPINFGQKLLREKNINNGVLIILIIIIVVGLVLGLKKQPNNLGISTYQPTKTPNIQELNINIDHFPLGFKEIGCEEGINNEVIIDSLFNFELEKAKIIYSKCLSNAEKDNPSFVSEVILFPLTQGEINNITSTYQGSALDLYLLQNPKISLLQKYSDFGDFSLGVEMSKVEDDIALHYQIIQVIKDDFFVFFIKIGLNNDEVVDFENIILESLKSIESLN